MDNLPVKAPIRISWPEDEEKRKRNNALALALAFYGTIRILQFYYPIRR